MHSNWVYLDSKGLHTGICVYGTRTDAEYGKPPGCSVVPATDAPPFQAPTPTQAQLNAMAAVDARAKRDALLAAADKLVLPHLERGDPVPANVREYRQALRDVPAQPGFPHEIVWPTMAPTEAAPAPPPRGSAT